MALTLPVAVYGAGDLFSEYFNAIAAMVGDSSFALMVKLAVLLAGLTVLVSVITKRDVLLCVRWLGTYYFVFYILFWPQVSVEIIDRINNDRAYRVDHVPLGLGVVASLTSTIGDSLTRLTDKIFSMPDDLSYNKTGMVMASKLAVASGQFQITDPQLDENMRSFMNQCVFYDLLLNKYSINDLFTTSDMWGFIKSHASPARAFLYNRVVTTCAAGVGKTAQHPNLEEDLSANIEQVEERYANRMFPTSEKPKEQLLKYLPMSYSYLLGLSSSAKEIMQQNLVANAIQDGALKLGATVNAPAALESYAFTRAQDQQRMTQQTLGDSAAYWLPIMKNAFESIMYGCFVFIILLAVFPFGLAVLKNYAYTLFWIQTWAPLYAIIHMICSYYAKVHSLAASPSGITLQSLSGFLQVNQDMASLAGYLTLSVPFLAAGLVKGMAGTMTQLAQYIGGVTQSAGMAASSEATTGNISLGNTTLDTHSAFSMSANHLDAAGHMSSAMSYQMPGGEAMNITPDGTVVMDRRGAISNLGVDMHLSDSIRNSAMQQAEQSENAAISKSQASSQAQTSAIRDVSELANHVGSSRSSGESWAYSTSSSTTDSFRSVKELTQRFADEHHVSYGEAATVLSRAHGQLDLNGSIGASSAAKMDSIDLDGGIGISMEGQHAQSAEERKMYSDAQDFVKNTTYSRDVENAIRTTKDQSLHVNNDEGRKFMQSISASSEKANTFRAEAASSFQSAESYRHIASQARENAVSIDVNASQALYDYISSQPGTDGHGHMGASGTAAVLRDPVLAKHYADRFAAQYVRSEMSQWNEKMAHSKQDTQTVYEANNMHMSSAASVEAFNQNNQAKITGMSVAAGLGGKDFINNSLQQKVEGKISHDDGAVHNADSYLTKVGQSQEAKVKSELAKQRHDNLLKDTILGIDTKDN